MAHQDTGLGTLSKLPREVRDLIWKEILSVPVSCGRSVIWRESHLDILRVGRRIHEEAIIYVQPESDRGYTIVVSPHPFERCTIKNGRSGSTRRKLKCKTWSDATGCGLQNANLENFPLQVHIYRPEQDLNQGWWFLFFRKVHDLVLILRALRARSKLEVVFASELGAQWFLSGNVSAEGAVTTVAASKAHSMADFEIIYLMFLRLKNLAKSTSSQLKEKRLL